MYLTTGVYMSNLVTVVKLALKLDAYLGEIPFISIENVQHCCDLDRGQNDLVDVC